jgi:hypothetical protein
VAVQQSFSKVMEVNNDSLRKEPWKQPPQQNLWVNLGSGNRPNT